MGRTPRNPPTVKVKAKIQPFEVAIDNRHSARLTRGNQTWFWRILTQDVLLLEVHQGTSTTPAAPQAWEATPPSHWDADQVETQVVTTKDELRLSTPDLRVRHSLKTGAWRVETQEGFVVFESPEAGCVLTTSSSRLTLNLVPDERILGLGETTGPLDKRGTIRDFWNQDVFAQASCLNSSVRNLYVSIPWLISLRQGRAAGLFWDSPARQSWDLGCTSTNEARLTADTDRLRLFLFSGPAPNILLERFSALTGRMPMPPIWSLGYHQSRYSYADSARLEEVAARFRAKQLPCDALHLDIHHMREYRVFTFGAGFKQPARMLARLKQRGFRVVAIVDPGVKDDPAFPVLRRGQRHNAFVKTPDGKHDYTADVWPGRCRFPDFLNAATRTWWGNEQGALSRAGISGFWNDMNEPSVFNTPGRCFDPACLHRIDGRNHSHTTLKHSEVHNLYGASMAQASYEGALRAAPNVRPFILTRAACTGIQRHAAVWTGDNSSTWEHLAASIPTILSLGLSGIPFCGADTGGFLDHCTGELLARWMQLSALTPFFRNHSNLDTHDQEPWAFGADIEASCRSSLELRYRLLPYLYSLFVEASRYGTPIARPMAWDWPNDPQASGLGDQFMLGSSLLVAPILAPGAHGRSVYLPAGKWYNFFGGGPIDGRRHVAVDAGLDRIPLFVRAGAVLPLYPVRQHTGQSPGDTAYLHVWTGVSGIGVWYEDDGASLAYRDGSHCERVLYQQAAGRVGTLVLAPPNGDFKTRVKHWEVLLHGAPAVKYRVSVQGRRIKVSIDPATGCCTFPLPNIPDWTVARWW